MTRVQSVLTVVLPFTDDCGGPRNETDRSNVHLYAETGSHSNSCGTPDGERRLEADSSRGPSRGVYRKDERGQRTTSPIMRESYLLSSARTFGKEHS